MNGVHAYRDKRAAYFGSERAEMLDFIPPQSRKVLEVGCGSGTFARLLRSRGAHVTGIEPFESAARSAREHVNELVEATAEDGLHALEGHDFDCIVFNDVLEHLVEPTAILRKCRDLLAPGGLVVASIPNLRYFPVLRELVMRADFRYVDEGVLDRTHLRFFTGVSICRMFDDAGYRVERICGINPLESWKHRLFDAVTLGRMRDTRFKQYAVVAAPRADPEAPVRPPPIAA